jgi:phosphatidylglycerophosphatase A
MIHRICKKVATLGCIGYFPAPGTCGTFVTASIIFLLSYAVGIQVLSGLFIGCLTALGLIIIQQALACCGSPTHSDPREIVLDEVIGMCVTMWGIPITPFYLALGFVLFRFFDILKPCGIARFEKLPGAWGVVADDVVAGLVSNIILWCLYWYMA